MPWRRRLPRAGVRAIRAWMDLRDLPERGEKICVLLSGGVDSALLLHVALEHGLSVFPVHISCGFVWETAERAYLQKLLSSLNTAQIAPLKSVEVDVTSLLATNWAFTGKDVPDAKSPDEAVFIPGRNLLLFSLASMACRLEGLQEIWIGSLKQNPFSDTTDAFFRDFEQACRSGLEISIRVRAPFRELEKSKLLRLFPHFPYELTFSCIHPQGNKHCGICNKCEERRAHLKAAGIEDKTEYEHFLE